MRRRLRHVCRLLARDDGAAIVEVVFLGVLLFLPLVYLVVTLGRVQAGAYAAASSAREAGRLFVTAPDGRSAAVRADRAAEMTYQSFGVEGSRVQISCSADPCLTPEAAVITHTEVRVALPLIPDFLSGVMPTTVTVTATHVEQVDRYREPRP